MKTNGITKVAAVQMLSGTSLQTNLDSAARLIELAAQQGAELVVLPEVFATISERESKALGEREKSSGFLQDFLSNQAKQNAVILVGGTVPVQADENRNFATVYVHDSYGDLLGIYRKVHLFDAKVTDKKGAYKESDSYAPGDKPLIVDTPIGRLGVAVCYDLRFPEMFRYMASEGMDLLAVPAAFTKVTGLAHWQALIKSRAIECQCAVVGANQGGDHENGRETSGQSSVVDHWGRVLADCDFGEQLVVADIDWADQKKCRDNMPVMQHLRFSISPP